MKFFKSKEKKDQLPHPFSANEGFTPEPPKTTSRFNLLLKVCFFLLVILTIGMTSLTVYLYQFRRNFIVDNITETEEINDNSISKVEAEKLTLQSITKQEKKIED